MKITQIPANALSESKTVTFVRGMHNVAEGMLTTPKHVFSVDENVMDENQKKVVQNLSSTGNGLNLNLFLASPPADLIDIKDSELRSRLFAVQTKHGKYRRAGIGDLLAPSTLTTTAQHTQRSEGRVNVSPPASPSSSLLPPSTIFSLTKSRQSTRTISRPLTITIPTPLTTAITSKADITSTASLKFTPALEVTLPKVHPYLIIKTTTEQPKTTKEHFLPNPDEKMRVNEEKAHNEKMKAKEQKREEEYNTLMSPSALNADNLRHAKLKNDLALLLKEVSETAEFLCSSETQSRINSNKPMLDSFYYLCFQEQASTYYTNPFKVGTTNNIRVAHDLYNKADVHLNSLPFKKETAFYRKKLS